MPGKYDEEALSALSASAATQKEEVHAKAQKAKEVEEAQKKLADMMVEAQKKVLLMLATPPMSCFGLSFCQSGSWAFWLHSVIHDQRAFSLRVSGPLPV